MTATVLEVRNAIRRYNGRVAMVCDHLQVCEKDCIAITGDNGSGKSTLLRVLAGITQLNSGTIKREENWRTAQIAYLPQTGGLYGDLTVDENLAVYRRLYGAPSTHGLFNELWEAAALEKYAQTKVRSLSGGYAKIAALAAVLSVKAQILLLDEPSSELTSAHVNAFARIIARASEFYLVTGICEHATDLIRATSRTYLVQVP